MLEEVIDLVNHPPHYRSGGLEVIDVIEAFELNFRLANSIKYILRANKKGAPKSDLEKARWYLDREISKLSTTPESPKEPISKEMIDQLLPKPPDSILFLARDKKTIDRFNEITADEMVELVRRGQVSRNYGNNEESAKGGRGSKRRPSNKG